MPIDYNIYIHSDAWKQKRQQRLDLDNHTCQMCGATDKLEVHHITYDTLGFERMEDLITLCEKCHTKVHSAQSYAWCFKHHRYPNKGIEIWVKSKEKRRKKNARKKGAKK